MRTTALWLFGVLACVGLARAAGDSRPDSGNDRGEGLFIPSVEDGLNGDRGRTWEDDSGLQSTKKSRSHAGKTAFAGGTSKSTAKPEEGAVDRDEGQQEEAAGTDSGASWISGVSQPWILIPAALGGLCLAMAPVWLVVRRVRAKRVPRTGVGGRPRLAGQSALAASLVQTRLNQGPFAETAAPEEKPTRRAA